MRLQNITSNSFQANLNRLTLATNNFLNQDNLSGALAEFAVSLKMLVDLLNFMPTLIKQKSNILPDYIELINKAASNIIEHIENHPSDIKANNFLKNNISLFQNILSGESLELTKQEDQQELAQSSH